MAIVGLVFGDAVGRPASAEEKSAHGGYVNSGEIHRFAGAVEHGAHAVSYTHLFSVYVSAGADRFAEFSAFIARNYSDRDAAHSVDERDRDAAYSSRAAVYQHDVAFFDPVAFPVREHPVYCNACSCKAVSYTHLQLACFCKVP